MTNEQITEIVITSIKDFFDIQDLKITEDTVASDVEDWDSVAHIQLIFEIESAFDIQFPADSIAEMNSVKKIVEEIVGIQGCD
jgi:acyl carrier protein